MSGLIISYMNNEVFGLMLIVGGIGVFLIIHIFLPNGLIDWYKKRK